MGLMRLVDNSSVGVEGWEDVLEGWLEVMKGMKFSRRWKDALNLVAFMEVRRKGGDGEIEDW